MSMNLHISDKKKAAIQSGMIGLFFEDINYAADGGLYAELIENGAFEALDCYENHGDFYIKPDHGYAWRATRDCGEGHMEFICGDSVNKTNPHYLRFTATDVGQGFANKAYSGIYMEKGKDYRCSFYAKCAHYEGDLEISVRKEGHIFASAKVICLREPAASPTEGANIQPPRPKWHRYEAALTATETATDAAFVISLTKKGIVEFDHISLMPADAVAGIFRRDLFELLKGLKPGFLRFPGGCIVEGATLDNRYNWKDTVGCREGRRRNWNRWAVHEAGEENDYHTRYAHYNQSYGLGFYEYFLLCELIGAKPLPVLNVGLACQFQSQELVELDDPAFQEFLQDAADLIEFANGGTGTKWGALRAQMGHPEPFRLTMLGIGNEQWQTKDNNFFARYTAFEKKIHGIYPDIRLIGSAGPDIVSERYQMAWDFYREEAPKHPDFVYAVDEHYYVKPDWFYEHTDFYDSYPRDIKVFSGEYAAHPAFGMNRPDANTLGGALAEAAFLTGVERNADVVVLASYAPLLARVNYAQWSPDMIWFDERCAYGSPSYYVQKMYGENMGTVTLDMEGQEKTFREKQIYLNLSLEEQTREIILKAVNHNAEEQEITLELSNALSQADAQLQTNAPNQSSDLYAARQVSDTIRLQFLTGEEEDCNCIENPAKICVQEREISFDGKLTLPANSFVVARIPLA